MKRINEEHKIEQLQQDLHMIAAIPGDAPKPTHTIFVDSVKAGAAGPMRVQA